MFKVDAEVGGKNETLQKSVISEGYKVASGHHNHTRNTAFIMNNDEFKPRNR
jgi:hypothetical protein